jgi:hypothetical protein|eukprot:TRINITY_DN3535_c0_g1_i1.p2 TRINITY_DN3535_c0_g1~~TRINITY_DN3535_c0_g1_i1.p2  ORF type:complete len:187 (-),score=109.75 TRINITY_DN3535_c0_g1_i1:56-616(-)
MSDAATHDPKLIKAVIKEGGKKGVEIEGVSDMGGLSFFCTHVEVPAGDAELLRMSMDAMNAQATPGDEERKGCSGHVGKMILSDGVEALAILAYVPDELKEKVDAKEWLQSVLDAVTGGEALADNTEQLACGIVKADKEAGKFPLKDRDVAQRASIAFLRAKDVFPAEKDDSSSDFILGDDELGDL